MAKRPAIPSPSKSAADTRRIMGRLYTQHPGADTELKYTNPYELLVATILSAQCTDERVNQVTPALFRRYPDARALARATTDELEPQIQSTGFFRAKSRALAGMAGAVVEHHGGEIPATMDALVELPGVGRKTANVVLGHALGVPGLPVDRHVLRVANRIGIARSDDPVIVEQQLNAAMPPAEWTQTSDTLILHGRRICKPRPLCERCVVRDDCDYYREVVSRSSSEGGSQKVGGRSQKVGGRSQKVGGRDQEPGARRQERRAAKATKVQPHGTAPPSASESRSSVEKRRAAKAAKAHSHGMAPPNAPESGSSVEKRRAAKAAKAQSRGWGPAKSK